MYIYEIIYIYIYIYIYTYTLYHAILATACRQLHPDSAAALQEHARLV